jgi:hypothetical protein
VPYDTFVVHVCELPLVFSWLRNLLIVVGVGHCLHNVHQCVRMTYNQHPANDASTTISLPVSDIYQQICTLGYDGITFDGVALQHSLAIQHPF